MILFVWLNKPDSKTPETSSTYMTDHPSRHTVTKMDVQENPGEPTCECGLAILGIQVSPQILWARGMETRSWVKFVIPFVD